MRDEARALTRGCRTKASIQRPTQLPNTSDAQCRQKGYPEIAVVSSGKLRGDMEFLGARLSFCFSTNARERFTTSLPEQWSYTNDTRSKSKGVKLSFARRLTCSTWPARPTQGSPGSMTAGAGALRGIFWRGVPCEWFGPIHLSRGNVAVRMNRAITLLKRRIDACTQWVVAQRLRTVLSLPSEK